MEKLLFSPEEACEVLGVRRSFLFERLLATGELESLKIGRRRLIPRHALEAFVTHERERQAEERGGGP